MSFYVTLLGAILKITFTIGQWKQPLEHTVFSLDHDQIQHRGERKRNLGGSRQTLVVQLSVAGVRRWAGTETEKDTAETELRHSPRGPGQTQEFYPCLSNPGSTSCLCNNRSAQLMATKWSKRICFARWAQAAAPTTYTTAGKINAVGKQQKFITF